MLYNDKGVYESERYKDPMEGLIQVPCGKADPGETSYQAACRETREETGLHIKRVTCKKGKQPEHLIHKITIIECLTCGKMVEENQDYYCPPAREIDPTILTDKPWWDTTHSGSQTPSEITEEWYPEFQDGYETPPQQEVPISQTY